MKGSKQKKSKKIGYALFNNTLTKKLQTNIITKQIKIILQSPKWKFNYQSINTHNWTKFFFHINQANCKTLYLTYHPSVQILSQIVSPIYKNLINLNLQGNLFMNIQALTFLNADNIKILNLQADFLISPKVLYKIKWSNLQQIVLMNNRFTPIQFGRIKLKKRIKKIECQCDTKNQYDISNQDISMIAKLQSMSIKNQLRIQNRDRIKQGKLIKRLKQKYSQCLITLYSQEINNFIEQFALVFQRNEDSLEFESNSSQNSSQQRI